MARSRSFADHLRSINAALQEAPGAIIALGQTAEAIREGTREYKRGHWGRAGKTPTQLSSFANPHGVAVELGAVNAIEYVTQKGRDKVDTIYRHVFEGPGIYDGDLRTGRPVLCYAVDGSGLLIARAASGYWIDEKGIGG